MSDFPIQPLKFRTVDPETGISSEPFFLGLSTYIRGSQYAVFTSNARAEFNGHIEGDPVICQFTGLCDANGQDVFSGDVLKWDGFLYVVEWHYEYARYDFNALRGQPGMELMFTNIDFDEVKTSEVVGNRWQSEKWVTGHA